MILSKEKTSHQQLQKTMCPICGARTDYDELLKMIGDSRFVLLGEATHGTHEFYKARAEITKRLVVEKGFGAIAWEADWPDALRVNRFIQARSSKQSALEALSEFRRFPMWMWRNADVLDFIGWLGEHNMALHSETARVGVYGLDLYSLHSSMDSVIEYLEKIEPEAAKTARRRYACFEEFGEDPQAYGMVAGVDQSLSCEDAVIEQLLELQRRGGEWLKTDGQLASDELFYAEQNAIVAQQAERYYRAMYRRRPNTWNLRDTHMMNTLERLTTHLREAEGNPKVVVWAHNSHLGDARATSMQERAEINLGQLVRERFGQDAVSVGFTTFEGTVTAASDWGEPAERKQVRPGMDGSIEALFHDLETRNFLLLFRGPKSVAEVVRQDLLQRAIGVIYLPATERWSHYFHARIARQFDAVIHFDRTRAVEPLDRTSEWVRGDLPETYPSAV